jgi:hypothetical protein
MFKMAEYKERKINVLKFVSVLAITVLIFVAGILFGQFLTNLKSNSINALDKELIFELQDIQVQVDAAQDFSCGNSALFSLGSRVDDLGTKITNLENQLGKTDERITALKRPYSLLLVQHYLLIKDRVERCGENYTLVLFFYSNKPGNIDASERQGYILGYLANKYGYGQVKVYSLDGDLDVGSIKVLEEKYGVSVYPTTVINDKVFVGFHDRDEIEKLF